MASIRNKVPPSSNVLKIGSFATGIALILQCISIWTHNWIVYINAFGSDFNAGLWYICSYTDDIHEARKSARICLPLSKFDTEVWLKAVQVLECFGLVTIIVSGVLVCIQHCGARITKAMKIWRITLVALAGASIVIGVIIYGIRMGPFKHYIFLNSHLNYSFGLGATAGIMCFLVSGCLFADVMCTKINSHLDDYQVRYTDHQHTDIINTALSMGVVTVGAQGGGLVCPQYSSLYGPPPDYWSVQQTTTTTTVQSGQNNCAPPPYSAVTPMNAIYV